MPRNMLMIFYRLSTGSSVILLSLPRNNQHVACITTDPSKCGSCSFQAREDQSQAPACIRRCHRPIWAKIGPRSGQDPCFPSGMVIPFGDQWDSILFVYFGLRFSSNPEPIRGDYSCAGARFHAFTVFCHLCISCADDICGAF